MGTIVQDALYALRVLRKSPGFTLVAVLTLALGIGANVAIYSVVDAVLIDPLPYEDPDRLVFIWGVEGGLKSGSSWNSYPDVVDFEERNEVFSEIASLSIGSLTLSGPDREAARLSAAHVTHDLFPLLGVAPVVGRGIRPEEDAAGATPVVVIGEGLRNDLRGLDGDVLGRTLTLDGTEHTIVGVMPKGFGFPEGARLWVPLGLTLPAHSRGRHSLLSIARLKPDVTQEQATANMVTIAAALEAEYPESNHDRSARTQPVSEALFGAVRSPLVLLFGAVGLVLLIACGNVANLLLARVSGRRRELAIRGALGAGPFRLVRQLLTESVILALIGGVCGVAFAIWGLDLLVATAPQSIPRIASVGISLRALGFAFAVTIATGILFGLAPAFQGRARDIQDTLKEGGRGWLPGGRRNRMRQALVVVEIALAFIVVVGAGLLSNSYLRLTRVDPGFHGEDVLAAHVTLPEGSYPEWRQATRFFETLVERIERLPGVETAAAGYEHPLAGGWETSFVIPGVFEAPDGQRPEARIFPVTPGYFTTVGMELLAGRDFTDRDDENAPGAVIINASFANRFFPDGDALGHTLKRGRWWPELPDEFQIVGVVADVKMDGLASATPWSMYYPQKQQPFQAMWLFARATIAPEALAGAIRTTVREMDPNLPVENISTLGALRAGTVAQERFQVTLLNLFATIALILSAIGIYGVVSSGVAQRRGEIGVRIALGANPFELIGSVLLHGLRLALVGLVIGVGGALLATRLMSGLLFEVSATDVPTMGAVGLFFGIVAALACLVPAARATRTDPMAVLRTE